MTTFAESTFICPLPSAVRDVVDQNTHPGLFLDKYAPSWSTKLEAEKLGEFVQQPAVDHVARLSRQPPEGFAYNVVFQRYQSTVTTQHGSTTFNATTSSPLTLHLARASALENAGICLHPVYGFCYLPGTGLKGMARSFAETVWFPTQFQSDASGDPVDGNNRELAINAWHAIEAVFGWAPASDADKRWKPKFIADRVDENKVPTSASGSVIFHDSWATQWPELTADILNNHHRDYYNGDGPPDDWERPVMVSFLAVKPRTTFSFSVALRQSPMAHAPVDQVGESSEATGDSLATPLTHQSGALLQLAEQWLMDALVHQGAGAKTATGYGCFADIERHESQTWRNAQATRGQANAIRASASHELKLVTPAFLAGRRQFVHDDPNQDGRADCELRSTTLRGQLRWWWRTMHAAHVDDATLRALEAAVWGDTSISGAIRIALETVTGSDVTPREFDRRQLSSNNKLKIPPADGIKKRTPGLTYHSYGMDERGRRRYFIAPGASWTLTFSARPSRYLSPAKKSKEIVLGNTSELLEQATAALWLLCEFGGVGAKSRKGFGNFTTPDDLQCASLEGCKAAANTFRETCNVPPLNQMRKHDCPPALDHMVRVSEVQLQTRNYWLVLDQVGAAAQNFAQTMQHNMRKAALGLPRRIYSAERNFHPGPHVRATDRHTSPVFYHVAPASAGGLQVRVIAFPASELPSFNESQQFFQQEFTPHVDAELQCIASQDFGNQTPVNDVSSRRVSTTQSATVSSALPSVGDTVQAELLAEKTKRGGWKAKHAGSGLSGPIQNSHEVPDNLDVGSEIELRVTVCRGQEIAFRYVDPAAEPPKPKKKATPRGKGRGR